MLKGAIIGFGRMAEFGHVPGWMRNTRVRIKAVVDPRAERRIRAKEVLGDVATYPGVEEMLHEERLDFVDIATPPLYHGPLILQCLRNNLHVLCEKPFVTDLKALMQVKRLVQRTQKTAFPVHNWKYAPILAKAIEYCRNGTIGKIVHSEFHTLRTQPAEGLTSWRDKTGESGGGGILMDHGWHGVYILCSFHGERPQAVSTWMHPHPSQEKVERSVHMLFEFATSTAALYLTWEAGYRHNAAKIYGTDGRAHIEDDVLTITTQKGVQQTFTFPQPLSFGSHHPEWFDTVIEEFLEELEHPEHYGRGLEEARTCLISTVAAYASARRNGRRILLSQ